MSPQDIHKLLNEDEDFIVLKRFKYSLKSLLKRYPNGCPEKTVAAALDLNELELKDLYGKTIIKLRAIMKV